MASDDDEGEEEYHGDSEGATPLGTPRSCTDCFWLLLLLLGCGGLCAAWSFALQRGDPRWLSALPDSDGQLCGVEGRGRLLFVCAAEESRHGELDFVRRVCVDACPGNVTANDSVLERSCPWPGAVYPSAAIAGIACAPAAAELKQLVGPNAYFEHALLVSEVQRAWPLLLISGAAAVVLTLFYLCLLETFAMCLMLSGFLLLICSTAVLGGGLIYQSKVVSSGDFSAAASHFRAGDLQVEFVLGTACCCASFVLLCIACCQYEQLSAAGESIQEACRCIIEEPSLLLEPCIALLCRVVALGPLLLGFLWLLSCGRRAGERPAADEATQPFLDFDNTEYAILAYYVFMTIWIMEMLHALSVFVIAYTVESWYFQAERSKGAACCGLCRAYCAGVEHHLGTLACGALLISMLRFARIVVGALARQASDTDNPVGECLGHFCSCVVDCFSRWLECVSKNAYMDVAMNSTGFCAAARHALELLSHEAVAEAALNVATPLLQLSGLGGISAAGALLTFGLSTRWPWFCDPGSDHYVRDPNLLAGVAAILSFLVAWPFLHIFDTVADTILYCIGTEASRKQSGDGDDEGDHFACLAGCFGAGAESERLLG